MIDINELRRLALDGDLAAMQEIIHRLEAAEKDRARFLVEMGRLCAQCDALRAEIERMTKRLRLILEEPENTMSNSKAMREMLRQARLALEESK